jgi:hypothetical protein
MAGAPFPEKGSPWRATPTPQPFNGGGTTEGAELPPVKLPPPPPPPEKK